MKRLITYHLPACSAGGSLITIFLVGAFLRFYKLDWGSGYFFHPDEYHIAAGVDRLSFPTQMNPHLFSYGSFTVYLIYFTQSIFSFLTSHFSFLKSHFPLLASHFSNAILIGRFYSALFSTLTILLVYLISKTIFSVSLYRYIVISLVATLPGLIQQAHFATPESILTFWLLFTLLIALKFLKTKKNRYIYFASASQGFALGTKIVALTFVPVVLLPLLFTFKLPRISLIRLMGKMFVLLLITFFFFSLSFPYALLDWQSFRGSWEYESGVATGRLPVFYTRQFIDTTPIIFQFQKIFPYALGPGVLVLGGLGLLGILGHLSILGIRRKPHIAYTVYRILLLFAFLCYFLPNAFLFAKWTRFMAPIFPFFAIFAGFFFQFAQLKLLRVTGYGLVLINLIWAATFFSIYLHSDVRLVATAWLNQNLPANSVILTESGNMLEVPLEGNLKKTAFDFYHLEENKELQAQLPKLLAQAEYFIIQSRRIFSNHQRLPAQFPKTANFYNLLFTGELGFEKIKGFNSFPKLELGAWSLELNDEVGEETWSVFDHPVIRIYKKTNFLTKEDYEKILEN